MEQYAMTEQEACEMFEVSSIQELKKKIVLAIQFAFIGGLILQELGVDGFDGFDQRLSKALDRVSNKKLERKIRKDGRD